MRISVAGKCVSRIGPMTKAECLACEHPGMKQGLANGGPANGG